MDDGKTTRYVKCDDCGTVYASPRASYAERYAWLVRTFGLGDNALQNAEARQQNLSQEALLIQQHVTEGRLLDVGCDLGHLFHWFPSPNWDRYGVEVSPSAAKYASKNYIANVFTGTLQQATFLDSYFDIVTLLDTLYYLDNPQSELREIHRILKPGGKLAIEISGQAYQLLRSRGIICWLLEKQWTRISTDSSYINWITPIGMKRLLSSCGFQVCSSYIIGSPTSKSHWRNILSALHLRISLTLSKLSYKTLTWAPKYLVVAKPT